MNNLGLPPGKPLSEVRATDLDRLIEAQRVLGATATLEFRLVYLSAVARAATEGSGPVPFGRERFTVGRGAPVVTYKEAVATGEMRAPSRRTSLSAAMSTPSSGYSS